MHRSNGLLSASVITMFPPYIRLLLQPCAALASVVKRAFEKGELHRPLGPGAASTTDASAAPPSHNAAAAGAPGANAAAANANRTGAPSPIPAAVAAGASTAPASKIPSPYVTDFEGAFLEATSGEYGLGKFPKGDSFSYNRDAFVIALIHSVASWTSSYLSLPPQPTTAPRVRSGSPYQVQSSRTK